MLSWGSVRLGNEGPDISKDVSFAPEASVREVTVVSQLSL